MTCAYNYYDNNESAIKKIIFNQDKDGKRKIYSNSKDVAYNDSSSYWEELSFSQFFSIDKNVTKCPSCVKYENDGTAWKYTFSDSCPDSKLVKSLDTANSKSDGNLTVSTKPKNTKKSEDKKGIDIVGGSSDEDFASNVVFNDDVSSRICEDGKLFGDENLSNQLQLVINVFKILVPIILLVLGSLDFAKAVFAQDESAIKKSQSTFIKRLIIAVVIFLIPTIIRLILTIASGIWDNGVIDPSLCGLF